MLHGHSVFFFNRGNHLMLPEYENIFYSIILNFNLQQAFVIVSLTNKMYSGNDNSATDIKTLSYN